MKVLVFILVPCLAFSSVLYTDINYVTNESPWMNFYKAKLEVADVNNCTYQTPCETETKVLRPVSKKQDGTLKTRLLKTISNEFALVVELVDLNGKTISRTSLTTMVNQSPNGLLLNASGFLNDGEFDIRSGVDAFQ